MIDHKTNSDDFGPSQNMEVTRLNAGVTTKQQQAVATEVPFTIKANDIELATMLCTPDHLKELAYGFLFTSGFIKSAAEVHEYRIDNTKWLAELTIDRDPDPDITGKRLFTSGCGKGVTYASVLDVSTRRRIESQLPITRDHIFAIASWIQTASPLSRETGGLHTAGLSLEGQIPTAAIDDIGRHNAVDKVIGKGIIDEVNFSTFMLACSGRVSSEILQKARRAGMPIIVARAAPTHQTILRAYEAGITVVGFARGTGFTVYSHPQRIMDL